MELLKNFGFEPVFFTAQIINFLILAFIFKKYLYKPILKILKDRERTIASGLEDARAAQAALEKANAQKDEIIKRATLEAEKIIDDIKKNAEKLRDELLARSKSDASRIINDAREQATLEMKRVEEEAKSMALDLSRKLTERILEELFTKREKEIIVERNITKIQKL